jgi:histone-lysine N-methyltransferase SETMAR
MSRRQSNNQLRGGIAARPAPKKFRVEKSAGKILASIFWDQDGILLICYLPKGQTINAEYYLSLLVQLNDVLKEKHRGSSLRRSCSCTTMPRLTGYLQPRRNWPTWASNVLITTPYSPDLAPPDYYLFPGLKKQLKGRHFSSLSEIIAAAESWLDGQRSEYF